MAEKQVSVFVFKKNKKHGNKLGKLLHTCFTSLLFLLTSYSSRQASTHSSVSETQLHGLQRLDYQTKGSSLPANIPLNTKFLQSNFYSVYSSQCSMCDFCFLWVVACFAITCHNCLIGHIVLTLMVCFKKKNKFMIS